MSKITKIINNSLKIGGLLLIFTCIFLSIGLIVNSASISVQKDRDDNATATVHDTYVSDQPFGHVVKSAKHDQQLYFNMKIKRQLGKPCYVKTSWRWVLHLEQGKSVMWNSDDGTFFGGDKTEMLAQAFTVPKNLIPGHYTISRLALFKCGDVDNYAKMVKTFELRVE